MSRTHWLALLLVLSVTTVIYAPTWGFGYIVYDDPWVLVENPNLHRGITPETLRWAVTDTEGNYWHPVGNLVNLVAFTALGATPGAQHVVNVLLLCAIAAMVFHLLASTTGRPSVAFVGTALWAWHPLRVESAAWLTERVGLVTGLFGVAALVAYVAYARRPAAWRYALVVLCFCVSMMAKPTLLALPIAVLAFDVWPLDRTLTAWREKRWRGASRLVVEKLPLLLIALAFAFFTARMATTADSTSAANSPSTSWRQAMFTLPAAVTWTSFKTIAPTDLAVDYPWLSAWSNGQSAAALVGLISLTAVILWSRYRPLIAGWSWFALMLLPMLAGAQYRPSWVADRYTLVPHVLLTAAVACAFLDATSGVGAARPNFLRRWGALTVILGGLVIASVRQVSFWQSSETLFTHAVAVEPDSETSHHNLGLTLDQQGRLREAADHYVHAAAISPRYAEPRINLGIVAEKLGQFALAERSLGEAFELQPNNRAARFAMAHLRASQGRKHESVERYEQLAREYPNDVDVHVNYGAALEMLGDRAAAEAHYREALRLDPNDSDARANLDDLLAGRSHGATRPAGSTGPAGG